MKKTICIIVALVVGLTVKATIVTTINSVDDFQSFATSVNDGEVYTGQTVTLNVDINLQAPVEPQTSNWTPIGTTSHPFTGTFDGGGHTISNLYADGTSSLEAGLFGTIGSGGMVKDVHIASGESFIKTANTTCYIGSIAGYNAGTIVGCSNKANVMGYNWANARTGGIVGENHGTVQNCYNLGTVSSTQTEVQIGGIVGNNNGFVKNCFMKASVITGSSGDYQSAYPISGNNETGGSVAGCFYMNGSTSDVPYTGSAQPVSLANAADNSTTLSENHGKTKHILLSDRTLYTDGYWNTLCLPFSISEGASGYSPIAGAKVMTLTSSDLSDNTLTLNFEAATSIVAGKPYIVKWTDTSIGNLTNPVFMDVTVNNSLNDATTEHADFVGCFSPVTLNAGDKKKLYLSTKDSQSVLYSPGANITINPFRAYFELKNVEADVKSFFLNFGLDDTTDRIEALNLQNATSQSEWYTLDGRRLAEKPSQHGVYINGGRKVVIK